MECLLESATAYRLGLVRAYQSELALEYHWVLALEWQLVPECLLETASHSVIQSALE